MPSVRISTFEPATGTIGTGFCMFIRTSGGASQPTAVGVDSQGTRYPMPVTEVDGQRGLWSAYLDDGIDLTNGRVTVKVDGCVGGNPPPTRT